MTLLHWAAEFFQMVLENMQLEFMQQNILTLPFGSEFPPGSRDVIKNSIQPFSIGLQPFFFFKNGLADFQKMFPSFLRAYFYLLYSHPYWTHSPPYLIPTLPFCTVYSIIEQSQEIRNLSLCRKIFEHCDFVQNIPPVPEMLTHCHCTHIHIPHRTFQALTPSPPRA